MTACTITSWPSWRRPPPSPFPAWRCCSPLELCLHPLQGRLQPAPDQRVGAARDQVAQGRAGRVVSDPELDLGPTAPRFETPAPGLFDQPRLRAPAQLLGLIPAVEDQ